MSDQFARPDGEQTIRIDGFYESPLTNWVLVKEEPCQWCAIWIGPHAHSVRDDGSLGVLVRRLDR